LEVINRLREAAERKRPEGWRNKTWMLHHDNIPAHTSLFIGKFLAKHETTLVPQQPYSPDLAPVGFLFLFPKLNSTLKGSRFQTTEEIEEISLWDLRAIPQNAFQNWKKRQEQCINSRGEYFEGDKSY
jgi:transposase